MAAAGPKTLLIDIETTPNLAHVWGIWDQNIGLNQLLESTEVFCFAAKWLGQKRVPFYSVQNDGKARMIQAAYDLLDEADVVVHYNGRRFDVPHLNREFMLAGMTPPSPFKQVDLLSEVKRNFKFPSNKLAYVSEAIGLKGKVKHEGHELWTRCMAGDRQAWATMRRYNIQDVQLLEDVYDRLTGWLRLPTHSLYSGKDHTCPACGSEELERRGFSYTKVSAYQQYRCKDCGRYSKGKKAVRTIEQREVPA